MEQVQTVLVCQHKACQKVGASAVLAAFEANLRLLNLSESIVLRSVRCLGQCGNGPMVLILPEQVWYDHVHPDEVPTLIEQHLKHGQPLPTLLHPKFHPGHG